MKRIIMMVLRNLFFVPYGWFMLNWYAGHVDDYPEEKRYALLKKIDCKANTGGNITIKSYGVENIPSENFGTIPATPRMTAARPRTQRLMTLVVVTIPTFWL